MADHNGEAMDTNCNNEDESQPNGLEGFITEQIRRQERDLKGTDNLDGQKRDDFISRALAESKRMNKEIEKSQAKREKLHSEFGTSRMDDWRNEHAAQVLTPQEQALVNQHHQ